MFKALLFSVIALPMFLLATGCSQRVRTESDTTPIRATVELTTPVTAGAPSVSTASGVSVLAPECTSGAAEACNGLDDNCDGRIDEGCGWQSGQIQITAAWQNGADIDLYVIDPFGFPISYAQKQSPSGGVLDIDARGACIQGSGTIENVYWSSPQPPRGNYRVELHYFGSCNVAGLTPVSISVSVGGRVIGVYNVTLSEQQRVPVVTFQL